ncbi:hypothetical protein APED_06965 [Acanthopleuribacter pedis]
MQASRFCLLNKVVVIMTFANGGENIEVAEAGIQQQMAARFEVAVVRLDDLLVQSASSFKFIQCAKQFGRVRFIRGAEDIEIKSSNRGTVKDAAHAAYHNKVDLMFG